MIPLIIQQKCKNIRIIRGNIIVTQNIKSKFGQ